MPNSTAESVKKKPVSGKLEIGFRELDLKESLSLGFRQEMLSIGDGQKTIGRVDCGAGLGTDFIILEWEGRKAFVRGLDLLKAWLATFDPESAKLVEALEA
jgi:hypothetical protein